MCEEIGRCILFFFLIVTWFHFLWEEKSMGFVDRDEVLTISASVSLIQPLAYSECMVNIC